MLIRNAQFWKYAVTLTCLLNSVTSWYFHPDFTVTYFQAPGLLRGQIQIENKISFSTCGWKVELTSSATIESITGLDIVAERNDTHVYYIKNTEANKNLDEDNKPLDIEIIGDFGDFSPTIEVKWYCFKTGMELDLNLRSSIFDCSTECRKWPSSQFQWDSQWGDISDEETTKAAQIVTTTLSTVRAGESVKTTTGAESIADPTRVSPTLKVPTTPGAETSVHLETSTDQEPTPVVGPDTEPTTIRLQRHEKECYVGDNRKKIKKISNVLKCSQLCIGDNLCHGVNYLKRRQRCDLAYQQDAELVLTHSRGTISDCQFYEVIWKK